MQGSNRDHSQRRKESKTTLMLFAVVVSFLVIDLPQGVLTVLNALVPCFYPSIYMPLGDFIDLLTLFQAVVVITLPFIRLIKTRNQNFIKFERTFKVCIFFYELKVQSQSCFVRAELCAVHNNVAAIQKHVQQHFSLLVGLIVVAIVTSARCTKFTCSRSSRRLFSAHAAVQSHQTVLGSGEQSTKQPTEQQYQ